MEDYNLLLAIIKAVKIKEKNHKIPKELNLN
jgi:hypothetical protein